MSAGDIAARVAELQAMPLPELRAEWQRHHPGMIMPRGLPRDLLVRSIAYVLQAREGGDLPTAVVRRLEKLAGQLARSGALDMEREVSLKPGTKLVRDWRGRTIRVLVTDDGYLLDDKRYASLSHIARTITGTAWSGPRFFGLKPRGPRRARRGARACIGS